MLEPKHNHFVQRGPKAPVEMLPCANRDDDCPFAGTSPLELGEWLGYLEAYVAADMKAPPEPFSNWLYKHRKVWSKMDQRPQEENLFAPDSDRVSSIKQAIAKRLAAYEKEVLLLGNNRADYQTTAKELVRQTVDSMHEIVHPPEYEVFVVWFCKTLRNWKALLGTTMDDGMYYEVTYNGANGETYVDVYKKTENITYYNKIPDAQDEG